MQTSNFDIPSHNRNTSLSLFKVKLNAIAAFKSKRIFNQTLIKRDKSGLTLAERYVNACEVRLFQLCLLYLSTLTVWRVG
jgi:hypothetical protein